jgi:translation initiation factor IF-2
VPIVAVSAKQGTGVPDLLETILLLWDMKGEAAAAADPLHAVVIETRVDKGQGMVATLIIRKGTLRLSTSMFEGSTLVGKVRAMRDAQDQQVSEAPPGKPVVVLGFTSLPSVGSVITDVPGAATAAAAASKDGAAQARPDFLEPIDPTAVKTLNLVVKADTAGSLEAVADKLTQGVKIVSSGVGDIREADVLLAKSAGAIIIGFGVKAPGSVAKLAAAEKVIFRTYTLIYELLDEISDVLSGMETVFAVERELGKGEIIAEFPFDKKRIAGTKVLSGRLAKGDTVKIIRGDEEIGRARIASMRKGKEEATKAEAGTECGVLLDKEVDFTPRDGIIAFTTG